MQRKAVEKEVERKLELVSRSERKINSRKKNRWSKMKEFYSLRR